MSERTALNELANFVGRSKLASPDPKVRRRTMDGISARLLHQRRTVGELLAAVLALSSRTRRVVQPRVTIEIDVFAPGGKRALDLTFGQD
ncbi:hypothetical protein ABIB57_001205 [Devosia sp. UYZn731]|uniref:hypothetical protein n=1 Tax=Devosia sp. UYZn731 TaxID=3156345 RepID=UPI003397024E